MAHLDRQTSNGTDHTVRPPLNTGPVVPGTGPDGPPSVTLWRLLGLATLTPTQAVHLAAEVLSLVDASADTAGADAAAITIDRDGRVALLPNRPQRDVGPTAELVEQIARNADRPAARRNPTSVALLSALSRCATALRDGDVLAARAALAPAARTADLDTTQATRELAALVDVALRPSSAVRPPELTTKLRGPAAGPTPAAPPVHTTPVHTTPVHTAPRRARRRPVVLIAVAVVAAAAAAATIALMRPGGSGSDAGPATSPTNSVHPGSHAPHHRATHVATHHRAVPALAPTSARAISKVTMTPAKHCRAGADCLVTVRVWLRPPWLSALRWHAVSVNRCTRHRQRIGAGSMIAGPGWRSAYTTVALGLPDKPRLAVVAVVDKPVSAASRPLLVNTGARGCG